MAVHGLVYALSDGILKVSWGPNGWPCGVCARTLQQIQQLKASLRSHLNVADLNPPEMMKPQLSPLCSPRPACSPSRRPSPRWPTLRASPTTPRWVAVAVTALMRRHALSGHGCACWKPWLPLPCSCAAARYRSSLPRPSTTCTPALKYVRPLYTRIAAGWAAPPQPARAGAHVFRAPSAEVRGQVSNSFGPRRGQRSLLPWLTPTRRWNAVQDPEHGPQPRCRGEGVVAPDQAGLAAGCGGDGRCQQRAQVTCSREIERDPHCVFVCLLVSPTRAF